MQSCRDGVVCESTLIFALSASVHNCENVLVMVENMIRLPDELFEVHLRLFRRKDAESRSRECA